MYRYIKQLMALPFLPAGHITPTFNALMIRANIPALQQLKKEIKINIYVNNVAIIVYITATRSV
jgi:hypothetical protein